GARRTPVIREKPPKLADGSSTPATGQRCWQPWKRKSPDAPSLRCWTSGAARGTTWDRWRRGIASRRTGWTSRCRPWGWAPGVTWVVANADRFLPYEPGSFDLVLSLDARLNAGEIRRVLATTGRLLVAVPAPDDLVELRAAVLGEGVLRDRLARAAELLAPG